MNKTVFCALLCLALPVFDTHAQAPTTPIRRDPLPSGNADDTPLKGNYVLTLTTKGKEQAERELSVVVATPSFNTASTQPNTQLAGRITLQGDGSYLVSYTLSSIITVPTGNIIGGTGSATYTQTSSQSISTHSSVLLNLGEPVQILKDGDLTYTLKVERVKPAEKALDAK